MIKPPRGFRREIISIATPSRASPTVGVDIQRKDADLRDHRRLAREGVAILMISDEIPEVLYHSHRVLVMREGRVTTDVPAEHTSEDALRQAVNA